MEDKYKIITREITVAPFSTMNVEVDCNSFIIKAVSGYGYINNMLFYTGGKDFEVKGNESENIKQSLTITTDATGVTFFVAEKRNEVNGKQYRLSFTLITSSTNFEVDCLDLQFYNTSGQTVYIDWFPLLSQQTLKISANANERIKQTFYITTAGLPETELWIIQRI